MSKAAGLPALIDSDLSIASTLPANFYIDPAIAQTELEKDLWSHLAGCCSPRAIGESRGFHHG